jgi:subtilase family serine protease
LKRYIIAIACMLVPLFASMLITTTHAALAAAQGEHASRVCTRAAAPNFADCTAVAVAGPSGAPLSKSTYPAAAYGPAQFHGAYNLPCSIQGTTEQAVCSTPASYGGQTIAIVDAYNDPTVESDLAVYDAQYGLPACTRANGCLTVVNQRGGQNLPSTDGGWALEISLDVQIAHDICQTCRILLVEARTASFNDLTMAENTAASMGATEVSNSWGASDSATLASTYSSSFNHPGIAVVAASGDDGWSPLFPATSRYVLAVGGTSLFVNSNGTYGSEKAWGAAGSGCASQDVANSWQEALPNWGSTGCVLHRASSDVAADADPFTGAAVYDSTPDAGSSGWLQVGGTSLASPLIAAVIALAGGVASSANAQQVPYLRFNATNSHDVTTGSNGSCGVPLCTATIGYDGPTGLGTPNGIGGF